MREQVKDDLKIINIGRSLSAENEGVIRHLAYSIPRSNYYGDYEYFKKSNPYYDYMFFYLILYKNHPIGFIRILPHLEGKKKAIEINECNLLPEYQGRGFFAHIFRQLLIDIKLISKSKDISFYHLEVDKDKIWLLKFYQKFGFTAEFDVGIIKSSLSYSQNRIMMIKHIK